MHTIDPISLITPRRKITGISAILLPFLSNGEVDWKGFESHVVRTLDAGLTPAINMDTGYAHLISDELREQTLTRTRSIAGDRSFVSGVFVGDQPGSTMQVDSYRRGVDQINRHGGISIFFQSYGLIESGEAEIIEAYRAISADCDQWLFFELGKVFAPFGRIYSLEAYEQLMNLPRVIGAKHSSLKRDLEWQRLMLRNRVRPDFKVFTGNDLAIDMVMYGSDYLLGLSTFAPDAFAARDAMWANGDPGFYEMNDLLQYLGTFTFRDPAPAYKHSAAMFLHLRGMIETNLTHPQSPTRPDSDIAVLQTIVNDLNARLSE